MAVAADGRSAEVKRDGRPVEFGTMACDGEAGSKDRTCWSTGVADAGYRVDFSRYATTGSVQLQTESIAGPHDVASLPCKTGGPSDSRPQPRPADPRDWTLEYVVAGGIAFNVHSLRIARDGALAAADRRLGMDVEGRASGDVLARLDAFLKTARDAKPAPVMPDQIGASIVVTRSGQTRNLEPTPDITAFLGKTWNQAIAQAAAGSWTQSGWKLCYPAAQMTADDSDTPIDDLTLGAGGTFEVTWRGGGARTTGVPHASVPDARGTYALKPELGQIQLSVASGVKRPRDFAGDGTFQIAKQQLTLKNVWLGTRHASHRPDVCELTFSRK